MLINNTKIWSQETDVEQLLEANLRRIPALAEKVDISVTNTSLQEFMRGIANSSGLNIDVDPTIEATVVNNFSNVQVKDILVFLARQHNLEIQLIGNIITITQKKKPDSKKEFLVIYDSTSARLTLDVLGERLDEVVKEITVKSDSNVILMPGLNDQLVSGYIRNMPFRASLEKFALSNGLKLKRTSDGFYIFEKLITTSPGDQTSKSDHRQNISQRGTLRGSDRYDLNIQILTSDTIAITAKDAPVDVLLSELSRQLYFDYFITPNLESTVTGSISKGQIDDVFNKLFSGTNLAYRKQDNIYIVGEKKLIDYNEHRIIHLQNRSVDQLTESLPGDIIENLEIKEFPELNSLFVTGPSYQIDEFHAFVKSIDKVVPVVLIEVMIVYLNKSYSVSTGIQAGIGETSVQTQGTVFPNVDVTIGAEQINRILNNTGWVNLGNVSPNFYLTLQAMETQGYIDLQSTPKLSTLNGHEATMAIGNTEYYQEEKTQLYGTQNPTQTTTVEYKAINAELSLKIKPIVSGDEQITLNIEVMQSDFTERISKTAPPGSVNREFTSEIRIKNKEMIVLGGLMEKRESDSGSGTPLLSRIPVIKWFFSSRTKEDSDSKLSVLIRPTIVN